MANSLLSTKTPVSALQELTVQQNYALPVYDLVHSESGTHDNTFHIKVRVHDQFAIGVGKSKKEAKHNSAQIMLELLTNKGNHRVVPVVKPDPVTVAQKLAPVKPVLQTQFLNLLQTMTPVSALQEFTVKQHHPLPVYDLVHSQSGTHDNTFHYRVQVRDYSAIGIGKSKKEAKHYAAKNLLDILTNKGKNLPVESHDVTDISAKAPQSSEHEQFGFKPEVNPLAQETNSPKMLLPRLYKHEQFDFKSEVNVQNPEGLGKHNHPLVQETNSVSPLEVTTNSIGILQEFTAKMKYPLPIYDLVYTKNSIQGNIFHYKVTVQDDFAVGTAKTAKDAKQAAAKNLIELYAVKGKLPPNKSANTKMENKVALSNIQTYQNGLQNSDKILNNHSVLQETGVVVPSTKNLSNSVGILPELMSKKNNPLPKYDLAYSKTGTYESFCCRDQVGDDNATGNGRSMKEAKHNAAENFLKFQMNTRYFAADNSDMKMTNKVEQSTKSPTPKYLDDHPLFQPNNCDPSQVMNDSTKTSISILQEIMAKKNYPLPKYELINCKSGTHDNFFHYQVQVPDCVAIGGGKSKKEAKHNAAQKLLDLLADKGLYIPEKHRDVNNSPGYQGYVDAQSNEQIVKTKFRSPEISRYSADKLYPADFTTKHKCITVRGTKLFATKDTLNRIMDVLPELKETCQKEDMEITDRDMEVREKYNLLFNHQKMNLNTNVCEFENQFKNAMKEKEVELKTIQHYFQLPRTKETLQKLLNEFEYTFSIEEMQDTPPISVLSITSDVPLMFMEMGDSVNEANAKVLDKAFTILETFMLQ